jgi:hypothetical protein
MNSQNEALNMLVQNMGHLAIYPSLEMCPIYSLLHLPIIVLTVQFYSITLKVNSEPKNQEKDKFGDKRHTSENSYIFMV